MYFSTVINPPRLQRACVCEPSPLPATAAASSPLFPASQTPLVFMSDLIALAWFSHSEPLYLHISNGWSCHGVVPLPVTMTVNMGAQCLEAIRFVHVLLYLNISPNAPPYALFPPLVLPSLCLLHHASVLFP